MRKRKEDYRLMKGTYLRVKFEDKTEDIIKIEFIESKINVNYNGRVIFGKLLKTTNVDNIGLICSYILDKDLNYEIIKEEDILLEII
jgi:hypothetical protein